MLVAVIDSLRLASLLLALHACDDAPPPRPDAAASRTREAPPPPRPEPATEEPPPEPRPRVIPLATASDLRSALRGANGSSAALWTLVDPERGLDVLVADDGTSRYRCHPEENARPADFPYMLDSGDRWTCDDALARCTSVDAADGSGYSFHFVTSSEARRLTAIVRYSGRRVPDTDSAEVAAFVAASGSVCRLRALVKSARQAAPAETAMAPELWTYRHPLQGADEDTPEGAPEERRRCGAEARRAAAALLQELGRLGDAVSCEHELLSCTYSAPFAERRLFARPAADGHLAPWAVADLASLPTPADADRQERDVREFLRRAGSSPCAE